MKRERTRRYGSLIVALAALVAMPGCKSYLAFGTATTFGLDVSQRADQTVDITMGYRRVEIASIPVQEDKSEESSENGKTVTPDASHTGDVYSVLGNFQVHYGNPFKDGLVLKQLFATGMAARALAEDTDMQKMFGRIAADVVTKEGESK